MSEANRLASLKQFANGMPESTKAKLRGPRPHTGGKNNPNWQGDKVGYHGIHSWLKKYFGKANKCQNPSCEGKSKKFEWALIKGKNYERRAEYFWMLCVGCHKRYDITETTKEKISNTLKGNIPWNKGLKEIMSKTITEVASMGGIARRDSMSAARRKEIATNAGKANKGRKKIAKSKK